MRSIRANHNQIAVSAYKKETAINTFQELDLSILAAVGDIIALEKRRENNADELTGREEADTIYDNGQLSNLDINFEKAQVQHFGFCYAYALGNITSVSDGTGFIKTILPMDGDLDLNRSLPSFTAGQRLGKTIAKQRYASMFMDSVTATFARDSWVTLKASCKGCGKMESNVVEETVNAALNASELTITGSISGTTDPERKDSVHQVVVSENGVWKNVEVLSATENEITITPPGSEADTADYKVLYASSGLSWTNFPTRISETPLRVSEVTFRIGGKYNGTDVTGGREMGAEINSIEHNLANNGIIEFTPGSGGAYASMYFREGRTQTLKLDREFRDFSVQNYMNTNEFFAAKIIAEGAEYEPGKKYGVELIFPKLGVLQAPVTANGKRLAEAGDMTVLEDDTYGSIIVKIKNLQQTYAV